MNKNIFSEILEFSKQLAIWQNGGIRQLFNKGSLTEDDITDIFKLAKIEYKLISNHSLPESYKLTSKDLPSLSGSDRDILIGIRF